MLGGRAGGGRVPGLRKFFGENAKRFFSPSGAGGGYSPAAGARSMARTKKEPICALVTGWSGQ